MLRTSVISDGGMLKRTLAQPVAVGTSPTGSVGDGGRMNISENGLGVKAQLTV